MSTQTALDLFPPKRDYMHGARAFIAEHPDAWRQIVEWAHSDATRGQRVATKCYVEMLRRYHLVSVGAEPYAVSNNYATPFRIILGEQYPHLKAHFERRANDWE